MPRWHAARAAEAEIAAGRVRGPLHGVPVGVKDIIDVAGLPTTCHSKILLDNVAKADAVVIAKLRQAGAIILGKLATHEFAIGGPELRSAVPAGAQSVEPGPSSGRLIVGLRRRRLRRAVSVGPRLRHRRFGAQSGQRLRHRRAEADLWPGVAARRVSAVVHARSCRPDDPHGGGQRPAAGRDRRPRSGRPRQCGHRRAAFRPHAGPRRARPARGLRPAFPRDRQAGASRGDRGGGGCGARAPGRGGGGAHRHPAVAQRVRRGEPGDPVQRGLVDPCALAARAARATTAGCRASG